jgi:hypothetical protein
MRRARKLLALPAADRWLLAHATFLVVAVRLGLWLLPFRIVRRLIVSVSGSGTSSDGNATRPLAPSGSGGWGVKATPERIAWAVNVASQYVPAAACLSRALAAEVLLAWHGYPAQLRIGVAKGARGQLEAHAWLEREGQILIGGAVHDRFRPLPNL